MTVIASRRFPGPALDRLPNIEIMDGTLAEGLLEVRADVRALAIIYDVVDDSILDLLPELQIVANYGVGYDNIDVDACSSRGVSVTNTPGIVDDATADLTLALLLASRRRVITADRMVRDGAWQAAGDLILGEDAHGATVGLIGCGRIGQAVARRTRGFGMVSLYFQRTRLPRTMEEELELKYLPLDDLLQRVDVLSIHCPLTPATDGLLGGRELALLRDGATVVNTARGRIIDEAALIAELRVGRLLAGLDVFAHEPHVPEALMGLSNVVLSPHLGTATTGTRHAMTKLVVDNILAALENRPILTPVSPGAPASPGPDSRP